MKLIEDSLRKGLPADLETESKVLGSMILYPADAIPVAIDLLQPEDFTSSDNQKVFKRLASMVSEGKPIDSITVGSALMQQDGLPSQVVLSVLTEYTAGLPKILNLDTYCHILRERSRLRMAILTLAAGVGRLSATGATLQTIQEVQASVSGLDADTGNRNSGFELLSEIVENRDGGGPGAYLSSPAEEEGIPWPLPSLTLATGGFRRGNTTLIGAETGGGKTTMATMCALHAAQLGYGVAILSAEMTKQEVSKKIFSQAGRLCLSDWLQGSQPKADRIATQKVVSQMKNLVIAIDDCSDVTPAMLESRLARLMRKHNISLLIVDYIQLMESGIREDGSSRERHVASISRSIKKICKRLGIAGIVLTQLNDDGKVRESRQIKMDASNVVILSDKGSGNFEASLEKARFSARSRIPLHFDGATGNFFEVDNR